MKCIKCKKESTLHMGLCSDCEKEYETKLKENKQSICDIDGKCPIADRCPNYNKDLSC